MRILLDTKHYHFSSTVSKWGCSQSIFKSRNYPNKGIICDWSIDELYRVYNRKFPDRISLLNQFLAMISTTIEIIPTPVETAADELKIRDVNDRPILRAAQNAGVDLILTGDKDFLESEVKSPTIVSPSLFLHNF